MGYQTTSSSSLLPNRPMSLITVRKCLAFNRVPALLQRTTATSFQLILLCYGPAITRYPAGFPFKQNPHWFTFHRNCSLDHFTLLPCHTMFWSDLHVHFRLASPPRGRGAARQSSHCPCGQSSIANIQAFTALETHCMLSKGAESLLMNALRPPPTLPAPLPSPQRGWEESTWPSRDRWLAIAHTSFAQCRSAGCCSVRHLHDWPQIAFYYVKSSNIM